MTDTVKLAIAATLLVAGMTEHVLRRGSIGVALVVLALAVVGLVVQDRLQDPERRPRRSEDRLAR